MNNLRPAVPVLRAGITLLLTLLCSLYAFRAAAYDEMGATADDADIVVGCLFPMSGRAGVLGRDSVVGIKLGLEYLAREPGNWPKLRVVLGDTKSKRATAVGVAERFINDYSAGFLCGVVNSSVAVEVSELSRERGVIMIGTDHASSRLTGELLHKGYFRVTNDSWQSMAAGALYVKERFADTLARRPLSLAYLGPDYEYGYQVWSDFRSALDRFGVPYEVVRVLWPNLNEPDYSRYISELISAKPDLVVNSLWGGDIVAFVNQAIETPLFKTTTFANFEKGGDYEIFSQLGAKMPQGLLLSSRHHVNWPDTELNRWFVNQFHNETGYFPSSGAEGAFAGILAIAQAGRAVGPPYNDREALIAALEGMKIKLPEDPDGFTSTIDPVTHQIQQVMAVGETVENRAYPPARVMLGNWRVYYPRDLER
ncbi:ABC transporter substrate-binding protein [Marinobacterium zhoushanense]|uniref:ABC transporter substrate-binding protein n=1 Tax=Marinobacterium zhoushanense TaxID=1679163 RepID=A0ABQ1KS18_9GAMM|nr:ABC transporter substrate-binding protein [Marinobacterium zhoushanense]GGC05363.1 ABC transporter substrate-binding protein [Marinobacterium zhoushanense]